MSALGTDRALKRRLDLFGMPASERGAPAPATVSDVRLPMQDRQGHPVAHAPARLVRLIRPPTAAAGVVGITPITRRPSRSVHGLKYDNVIDTVAGVIANVHAWCYVVGWLGTTVNEAEPRKRQRGGCMRGVAKASGIGDAVEPAGTSHITDGTAGRCNPAGDRRAHRARELAPGATRALRVSFSRAPCSHKATNRGKPQLGRWAFYWEGTQPGSCGPQEGIPGASLDSSGSGRGPGSLMSSRPVARRRNRYSGSSSGAGDGASSPTLSTTISPNMTSHNTQSTDHDQIPPLKQSASANDTRSGSRKRDKLKTITDANAPWGHSGKLKERTSPE
eukprot:scaffold5017_cov139-Isochrysis_galbana.AAC.8